MDPFKDQNLLVPFQIVADQQVNHGLFLLGLVIPCYDHTLTLSEEIQYIWRRPKRPSSYWFFLNRYLALSTNIINTIFTFRSTISPFRSTDPQRCPMFLLVQKIMVILQMVVIYLILALRVFAMYNRNKSMGMFLSACGFIAFGLAAWLATTNPGGSSVPPSSVGGDQVYGPGSGDFALPQCTNLIYPESLTWNVPGIAGAWLVEFGLDLLIFGLTLFRGLTQNYRENSRFRLIHCLVRDEYRVILVSNLMNILMLLPLLASSLSWMTSTISAAMVSRLMLNLHKVADAGIHHTTCTIPDSDVDSGVRFRSPAIELDFMT
ncbi:hypothetical protein C8J57DRAFT_1348830 [Mycena rebaudengoi]|nr:hypothetical protein C8J57DRAFT_1348830 [Mycena rebaudengoi]